MNVHIWCTLHSTSQGAELKRGIACFQRNIFLSFYRSISAFNFFWWGQVGRVAKKNPPPNILSCFLLPWRFWNYVFLPCLIPLVWWHITFTFSKLVYFLQTRDKPPPFLQCTMLPLSTKSCLKSSKLRPILNGQFCHAISKNICLYVLGSKQPWEMLVFVISKL